LNFGEAQLPSAVLTVKDCALFRADDILARHRIVQPFSSDAAARSILCDVEAERLLWVSAGSIRPGESMGQHWAHPLLVGMDTACDVLICTQADAMPRAYLLNPRFQPFYADTMIHPHPRADQTILYEGKALPGLCVFSSAELTFTEETNFYTQFLRELGSSPSGPLKI